MKGRKEGRGGREVGRKEELEEVWSVLYSLNKVLNLKIGQS